MGCNQGVRKQTLLCYVHRNMKPTGQCQQWEVGTHGERLGVHQADFFLFQESQTSFPSSLCSSGWPRDWVLANGMRAVPGLCALLGLPHNIFPFLALPVAWWRWAGQPQKHGWKTMWSQLGRSLNPCITSLHFPHQKIPTLDFSIT